jgi:hypothetical protein
MEAACPGGAGPNAKLSDCKRLSGSPRMCRSPRSLADCGSPPTRCTSGGADGTPRVKPASRRKGLADRPAGWISRVCSGWPRRWSKALPHMGRRGPALDLGPGRRSDRATVPHPLHTARGVMPVAPHGFLTASAGSPGDRAGRGGDRHVAAGGVAGGKTVAAQQGAWLCFELRREALWFGWG